MVEKVPVPCPNCGVRVRMPTQLRPGKKPRCPKCKIIIRPADVLPAELLAPVEKPVDFFAETKTLLPIITSRQADPKTEKKTQIPEVRTHEADFYAETIERLPDVSPPLIPTDSALYPPPLDDTVIYVPGESPPMTLEDTALPSSIIRAIESQENNPTDESK